MTNKIRRKVTVRRTRARLLAFVLALFPPFAFATSYTAGNYHINLRLPISIPTFSFVQGGEKDNHSGVLHKFSEMGYKNIQVGIEADVGYFLSDSLSLGGVIGYDFAYDRGDRIMSRVPVLFKANYFLFSNGKIDIPLSFALGVNYWKYHSMEHIVLQAGVEAGINFFWSDSWGVLFRTGFWIYPELYADSYKTNVSGFIPIVLGVTYRR